MSPVVKKVLIAIGAKKAIDKINEKRNPKPSKSRTGKLLLLGGLFGALGYAYNSGKLQPLIDKVRGGAPAKASSNGSGTGRDVTMGERPLSSPVA